MGSNSGGSQPPDRRIVLLTKVKTKPRLGAMTLAFFRRGEDLEATEFKNLPHDDPALVPPKLGFRSFDTVPRNRTPLLIAFLVMVTTCLVVLGWPRVRGGATRAAAVARATVSDGWVYVKEAVGSKHATP